jgi:hypothetical protein
MKTPRMALVAVGLLATAIGCRTAPVRNVAHAPFDPPVASVRMEEISSAIWAAGRREGWRVRDVGPGELRAEKSLRTHRALIAITYDGQGYGIRLLEADDLLYDGRMIHKTYNEWIEALERSIRDEMRFRHG